MSCDAVNCLTHRVCRDLEDDRETVALSALLADACEAEAAMVAGEAVLTGLILARTVRHRVRRRP